MVLEKHYDTLYESSSEAILAGNYKLDKRINAPTDSCFGITLLIRPSEEIKAKIQLFLAELNAIDPLQYYYPNSDLHITVMSIISCYDGFSLEQISTQDYIQTIQKSIHDLETIKIKFRGVTASNSAVMLQGFPSNEALDIIRNSLRQNFKKSSLEQSIDSRYTISTLHSTVMRFQEKLQDQKKLIAVLEKFRKYDFGEFTVHNLELVYSDWYQRTANTIPLHTFHI